jgi:hypothetical protein
MIMPIIAGPTYLASFTSYLLVFLSFCPTSATLLLYKKLLKLEIAPHSYAKPLRHPLAGLWEIHFEKR